MGSQTEQQKIPVIDFADETLKPGSKSWVSACKKIRHGLEVFGCFEANYGGKISTQLHNSIFSSAEELFDLPNETKMLKTSDRPGCNYVGQISIIPLYESLEVDNPTSLTEVERFTDTMWPSTNPSFSESVHFFSNLAVEIYEVATRMVFDGYGLGKLYESVMENTSYGLRFFKFRARGTNDTDVGVPTHTDKSFITLLYQNQVDGLKIRGEDDDDDGDHYVDAQPKFSSFMFLAGDALMAWSNGRIRACEHRVTVKETNPARYSVGLFSFVKGVMQVPEKLVDDDEYPLQYKPMDHFGYLRFYFKEGGTGFECPIKAYCGL